MSLLQTLKELNAKATPGPGELLHTEPMSDEQEMKIVKAIKTSIGNSRKYQDGIPWWFIETKDGRKVADFGCGPTSEANGMFWIELRNSLPEIIERLEDADRMAEHYGTKVGSCCAVPMLWPHEVADKYKNKNI